MRCALIWLVFLCDAVSAWAVNPNVRISQYGHTAWRIQDGFFDGAPYSIAQTADGYLWIGGANGLLRFDGVRFVPWSPPLGKQLPSPVVAALLAARDGSLWIGTLSGLSHWTNQDLVNYSMYANAVFDPGFEDEDGTTWVMRGVAVDEIGPLCQVKAMAMHCYGKADGIPEERYSVFTRDSAGNFWLGGSNSLTRWRPGSFQTYYPRELRSNVGAPGVTALASGPDGSLWVGFPDSGPSIGLQQFSHGAWKPFVVPGFDSSKLKVVRLFIDHQNALWVGTFGHGVYRIYGPEVDHFDSSEGLSGDSVYAFFEDKEDNLWVATDKGLDCFRDLQITAFSTREGLTAPAVASVQAMRDGSTWIGGSFALNILGPRLGRDHVRSIQTGKGLPGNQVTSLFEDHAGRHWVGIDNTLNIYENGRFTRITRRNGSPMGMILGITEDGDNNLWVLRVPQRMLIRIFDRKVQEELPTPQIPAAGSLVADPRGAVWLGLLNGDLARYQKGRIDTFRFEHPPNARVNQVLLNPDGSILGATTYGLIGWSSGKQQTLNAQNGLPCNGVNGMVEDGSGALWLYMQCAMVEIARSDLQRWWAQPNVRLQPRVFDVFDGLQLGPYAPFESQAVRTLDGRLWFANSAVPQMIDPAHLARNLIAPPVHVEQIIADRKGYALQGDVRLPARTRDVEIDYTALSFTVPQKVRFRYKLEGRDTDWEEAGTRRQTFYTDLRPGPYRFHVIACNNDGVWNNDGAAVNFNVAAAWYQSGWFRSSIAAAILLMLWGIYQLRLIRLAHQFNIRLEERVGERTRIARELHDTLLQTFHGLMFQFQAASNLLLRRPDEAKKSLDDAIVETKKAIAESRDAIQGLRSEPMVKGNLAELLASTSRELADANESEHQPVFDLIEEGERRTLSPTVSNDICRTALELMRNAYQHAHARRIEAEIRYGDSMFRLRIRDDGQGIEPKVLKEGGRLGHWGLRGTRERADRIGARLEVWSEPGKGTEVQLLVPASVAYESFRDSYRAKLFQKVKSRAKRS